MCGSTLPNDIDSKIAQHFSTNGYRTGFRPEHSPRESEALTFCNGPQPRIHGCFVSYHQRYCGIGKQKKRFRGGLTYTGNHH